MTLREEGNVDEKNLLPASVTLMVAMLFGCPGTVPIGPVDLTAGAVSTSSIQLQWTDAADNEIGFNVSRSESLDGFFEHRATLDPDTIEFIDSGLEPETTY